MIYITDYYYQWFFVLFCSVFGFSFFWIKPRYGWAAATFFFYAGLSSLYVWVFKENRYVTVEPYNQMALRYFAADSLAKIALVLFPLFMVFEKRVRVDLWANAFSIFSFFNCLVIFGQFLLHGCKQSNSCGGFVGNPSISVGLMVCMLPIMVRSIREQWILFGSIVLAVFISKSSIPVGLLALYLFFTFFPATWRGFIISSILGAFTLFAGYLVNGVEFLNNSDRFMIWKYMMTRWAAPINIPAGVGLGTYHVFSINLQADKGVAPGYYWNWLHNNWLTFVFEMGVIGGILSVMVYLVAVRNAYIVNRKDALIALILFGAYMFLNPALNAPFSAFFGAWLFLYVLRRDALQYRFF